MTKKEKIISMPSGNMIKETDKNKVPVLQAINLGIDFGGLHAVEDFNIAIGPSEISGIIGPNGAGKTTIFNLLTSVYKPTRGTILVDGYDTAKMDVKGVNRAGIARTFQNIRLFSKMTVLDNVLVGFNQTYKYSMIDAIFKTSKYRKEEKSVRQQAIDLLSIFELQQYKDELAGSLPYGQQRKLEIVRALATKPKVILLDEPAAGMNPTETSELMQMIKYVRDNFNVAILLIEHDMSLVMNICEIIGVLNYGKLIAKGTPKEIQSNPEVIEAYLGKDKE